MAWPQHISFQRTRQMKSLSLQSICQATTISSTVPCGLEQTIIRMNCLLQYRTIYLLKINAFTDSISWKKSMGEDGTTQGRWEKNTWPVLKDLAQNHPEAGIHFQSKHPDTIWLFYVIPTECGPTDSYSAQFKRIQIPLLLPGRMLLQPPVKSYIYQIPGTALWFPMYENPTEKIVTRLS